MVSAGSPGNMFVTEMGIWAKTLQGGLGSLKAYPHFGGIFFKAFLLLGGSHIPAVAVTLRSV